MIQKEYFQPLSSMIVDYVDSCDHQIKVQMHYHDGYEILFFEQASAQFMAGTELYTITDGDLVFIPSYTLHTAYQLDKGCYRRYYINIISGFLDQYVQQLGIKDILEALNEQQFFRLGTGTNEALFRRMQGHFSNIRRQTDRRSEHGYKIIQAELLLLLSDLYEGLSTPKHHESAPGNSHLRKMLNYIDQNLFEDITLSDLNEKFYLSRYYICRIFKQHTGLTISQYINRKKIMIAQQILNDSETTISEACFASGFKHMQYFCKVFKEITGLTPSYYKKGIRELTFGKTSLYRSQDSI